MFAWFPSGWLDVVAVPIAMVAVGATLISLGGLLISRGCCRSAAAKHMVLASALRACLLLPAICAVFQCWGVNLLAISLPRFASEMDSAVSFETSPSADTRESSPPSLEITLETAQESAIRDTNCPPLSEMNPTVASPDDQACITAIATQSPASESNWLVLSAIAIWLTGVMWMLARMAIALVGVLRLRLGACLSRDGQLTQLVRQVARELRLTNEPLLLVTSCQTVPLAVGVGRSAVIFPETLLKQIDRRGLRQILIHELAHIERGDHRSVFLDSLAVAIYWPIVPLHLLAGQLRELREELCDNVVLAHAEPISYGETLLAVAKALAPVPASRLVVGMLDDRGALERRIEQLLNPKRNMMHSISKNVACLVFIGFVSFAVVVSATRIGSASQEFNAGAVDKTVENAANPVDPSPAVQDQAGALESAIPACIIRGKVVDPAGNPVEGVKVYLFQYPSYNDVSIYDETMNAGPVRAVTDMNGAYTIDASSLLFTVNDGEYQCHHANVMVTAQNFEFDWASTRSVTKNARYWDPADALTIDLRLSLPDSSIRGTLLDEDGTPLRGATVSVQGLTIPKDRDLNAHLADNHLVPWGSSRPVDQRLFRPYALPPGVETRTKTDDRGRFKLSGLGSDRIVDLSVHESHALPKRITVVTRNSPSIPFGIWDGRPSSIIHGAKFTFQLEPSLTVEGKVVDRETGEPLPEVFVGYGDSIPRKGSRVRTDEKGAFRIKGLSLKRTEHELTAMYLDDLHYWPQRVKFNRPNGPVTIECQRTIPYTLEIVDQHGDMVEGTVMYIVTKKNPNRKDIVSVGTHRIDRAVRGEDGLYRGRALPGAGTLIVLPSKNRSHYDFEAIIPINPTRDSKPLKLTADVVRDSKPTKAE